MPIADASDVNRAVAAARRCVDGSWASTTGAQRAAFLRAMASKIEERTDALARLEAEMTGKPLPETVWDVEDVVGECWMLEPAQNVSMMNQNIRSNLSACMLASPSSRDLIAASAH